MLNTIICHEDSSLRSFVANYMETYFKRNHTHYVISTYRSLQALTSHYHPIDLLVTDVSFNGHGEMPILQSICRQYPNSIIVLLTNTDAYAIQGYKLGIFRYILTPQLSKEFPHCMDGVLARYQDQRDCLEIKFVEGKYRLFQDEISYLESQGHKVNFYISTGSSYRLLTAHTTIDKIQEELNPCKFLRPHKSFLVNYSYIDRIELGSILLQSGDRIPVSQSRRKSISALLTTNL